MSTRGAIHPNRGGRNEGESIYCHGTVCGSGGAPDRDISCGSPTKDGERVPSRMAGRLTRRPTRPRGSPKRPMSTSAARLPRRRQLLRQQTRQPPRLGRPQENPQPRQRTPAHRRLRRKSPLRPRYQLPPVQISSPVKGWRRRTARGTSSCGPTSIRGSTISVETKTTGTPRKARTCARRMRLDKGFGRRRTKSTPRRSP